MRAQAHWASNKKALDRAENPFDSFLGTQNEKFIFIFRRGRIRVALLEKKALNVYFGTDTQA